MQNHSSYIESDQFVIIHLSLAMYRIQVAAFSPLITTLFTSYNSLRRIDGYKFAKIASSKSERIL